MNTKHLKAKILDLAIRGKLVEQKAEDGNAFDLLQKIRDEKMSHGLDFANAKSRKNKQQPETALAVSNPCDISDNEIPFEIPENWCWCRLGEIGHTNIGLTYHPQDIKSNGIPVLRSSNIKDDKLDLLDLVRVETNILDNQFVKNGDILICARNGSKKLVGKCILLENLKESFSFGAFMAIFRSEFNNYVLQFLRSNIFRSYLYGSNSTQINQITQEMLKKTLFPLPPLPEQKRIVSAIEKAFAQIDIIEKNKLNLKTYIKQTKSKVLDLAIRGKLVEQNPQEGNAFELLEKIRNEKSELIKQKKLKENKNASFIIKADDDKHYEQFADGSLKDVENEILFEIPKNWCWCKGKSIFLPMTSRTPSGSEFKYIDIETVDNKLQKIHYPKILKTENAPSRASRETLVGDTIFSMVRPYLKNIALITEDLSDCIASTGFFICRPNKALDPKYLYYLMISNYVVNGLNQFIKGDNSPSINGDDITEFYFPLPPLPEQKRIVTKIEQVFEQLDMLEKSLGE